MGKDRNGTTISEKGRKHEQVEGDKVKKEKKSRSKSTADSDASPGSDSDTDRRHRRSEKGKRSRKRYSSDEYSDSDSESDSDVSEYSDSGSGSGSSSKESVSESEDEEHRRKRKSRERKRRREREEERDRKRRKREKEKKKRKEEKKKREKERRKKKEKKERGKKGAVTNSWGKYGIIRETDMWNKRPEFTAWLAEVKKVNLENLANWEEKQMFKDFMEDHNTATFPSKRYYNLDAYFRHQLEKEIKKGPKKSVETERTIFNDEEQRRLELLKEREKQKEQQVEELKRSMQSGMAQAMKEQAQLKEEMAYQYKLGNFEAAAAIQKRLDPDVAM